MATTADYINKLIEQKNALADNLAEKGVTATHNETFETLVPKVLDILGGSGGNGIYPVGADSRPTGDVTVPEGVTSLYQYIFYFNSNVTSVKLPESLTTLSSNAFSGCSNLVNVDVKNNVTAIPSSCFTRSKLSSFTFSSAITVIGSYAFQQCSNLSVLTFNGNNKTVTISSYAFASSSISSVNFATDNIRLNINASCAFRYCNSLTNNCVETIINHCDRIGEDCFQGCESITDVTITNAGNSMFRNCTMLTNCTLSSTITTMPSGLFADCTALISIDLPSTISGETNGALSREVSSSYYFLKGCTNLETVTLGENWNMNLNLSVSTKYSIDVLVSILNNLKDLSGETAKTLILGGTNVAKLSDAQKAIATNKNWTLA